MPSTTPAEEPADDAGAAGPPQGSPADSATLATTNIVDTVCVLYFAASNQVALLLDIMGAANYRMFVPAEVMGEAERRAQKNGWSLHNLALHLHVPQRGAAAPGQRVIVVIPEITAASSAMGELVRVRGAHPKAVAARPAGAGFAPAAPAAAGGPADADLGECVVITWAIEARRQGRAVVVAVDDLDAQELAQKFHQRVFTIEDAFSLAVEYDVLDMNGARGAYERLRTYGSSLPSWEAGLRGRLRREANERKARAKAAQQASEGS